MRQDIELLLPVIVRREHPDLAPALSALRLRGELATLLPGVYTSPQLATEWKVRAIAASRYDPAAVVVGEAAAALTYWPDLVPTVVEIARPRSRVRSPGFRFVARQIPEDLVTWFAGVRISAPALTAVDLIDRYGGDAIDRVLRSRRATLAQLHRALSLTANRRGNAARRRMVLDSRDEPWSEAERLLHRILRGAGIAGWTSNARVACGSIAYYVDVVFRRSPVCIEVDGREFHGPDRFEEDRRRGNDLLLAGKHVLHVTWQMVHDEPEYVLGAVRTALARFP